MSKRNDSEISLDEIAGQNKYIEFIESKNQAYHEAKGRKKKWFIQTYGCQMNEHDSERLAGMLGQMGYVEGPDKESADIILMNTCCIRENAELKTFGNLGHLKNQKKNNPELIIVVCGCMMQEEHIVERIKSKFKQVDLVFGTHNIHRFPELLNKTMQSRSMNIEVWDEAGSIIEGMPSDRRYDFKALVNIVYGCNNFCTYCIVPYTRGRERSREIGDIVTEIKELVKNGTREITLLGQNVNSYGNTLDQNIDFSDLIYEINKIEGLERLRFMTSHPKDLSDRLIETMKNCDKLANHIHLPIQAGSNNVLKRMNRKYTRESYLEIVRKIRAVKPNIAITTDIIVGFPGETDEDFKDTLSLVKEVEFDAAYTFLYSIRKGTPAENYTDQIPDALKHERFDELLEAINAIAYKKNKALEGETLQVLVEGVSYSNDEMLSGRASSSKLVNFKGNPSHIGKIVAVKITNAKTFSLMGEVVE